MNTHSLLNPCKNYLKRSFCQLTKARWKIKIEAWALSGRPTLLKRLGPSKQCCINFPQEKVVEKVWDKKLTISYDPSFVYFFMEICCWWTRLNNNGANYQILYSFAFDFFTASVAFICQLDQLTWVQLSHNPWLFLVFISD